ncbi:MAG TPA: hypothetical protein PK397_05075 [Ignavibacteriaceae bacterium]|nr:hypothetical protein [Ignavibacteriaceae bacterium]
MKSSTKLELLKRDYKIFLSYFKANYPVFHNSNVFFRDLQYAIRRFLESKGFETNYNEATKLAVSFAELMELEGVFVKTSKIGWKLNYPAFLTGSPLAETVETEYI